MKILFTLFIAFIFQYVQAQPQIENLVFEGAGIRGLAYAGAVEELESRNMLPGVKRVGGTSAGAIIALMISLQYTSLEIAEIIVVRNSENLMMDVSFLQVALTGYINILGGTVVNVLRNGFSIN